MKRFFSTHMIFFIGCDAIITGKNKAGLLSSLTVLSIRNTLLLLGCLLFVCSCKPEECHCTRIVNNTTRNEIRPLNDFTSCQELGDDLTELLGKKVDCF